MAQTKIIVAGFGGQGVMLLGELIAYAAMLDGKEVTWLPSYGPEMRGGTANCSVIVSDEPIASPVISEADAVVVMNAPSLEKFEPLLAQGGICFINSSLISAAPKRGDVKPVYVDCSRIAVELKHDKGANMVMLGAIVREFGLFPIETLEKAMAHMFEGKKAGLIPANMAAVMAWKPD